MRHYQRAGWVLIAGAAALGFHQASAAAQGGVQQNDRSKDQGIEDQQAPDQQGTMGRSPSGQRSDKVQQQQRPTAQVTPAESQCGNKEGQPYALGPLSQESAPQSGFGAGLAPIQIQGGSSAPLPQYWLADAMLFTGNAASAANVLALEHGFPVASPAVLGDQAQYLTAATNRALTSLTALQQNAESSNPSAVPEIRNAIGQLVAAQGAASQVAEATSGPTGPGFEATTHAAIQHLAAAEKAMASVGRSYNAPMLASITACPTRAFGAGLGATRKAPSAQPSQPSQPPPAPPPAPAPQP